MSPIKLQTLFENICRYKKLQEIEFKMRAQTARQSHEGYVTEFTHETGNLSK